jgi:hypothetical protein
MKFYLTEWIGPKQSQTPEGLLSCKERADRASGCGRVWHKVKCDWDAWPSKLSHSAERHKAIKAKAYVTEGLPN